MRVYELSKKTGAKSCDIIREARNANIYLRSASSKVYINRDNSILWETIINRAFWAKYLKSRKA